jgi:hypothetical protein
MKTNETPRLILNRETLRQLAVPAEQSKENPAFIIRTKFSCYSPISCPVPCA